MRWPDTRINVTHLGKRNIHSVRPELPRYSSQSCIESASRASSMLRMPFTTSAVRFPVSCSIFALVIVSLETTGRLRTIRQTPSRGKAVG